MRTCRRASQLEVVHPPPHPRRPHRERPRQEATRWGEEHQSPCLRDGDRQPEEEREPGSDGSVSGEEDREGQSPERRAQQLPLGPVSPDLADTSSPTWHSRVTVLPLLLLAVDLESRHLGLSTLVDRLLGKDRPETTMTASVERLVCFHALGHQ